MSIPLLGDRDFRLLGAGTSLNGMGAQGEQVVFGLLVYQHTGASSWVGIALALYFGPMLLVGAPAGAMADRMDRRRLLPALELASCVLLAVFGAIIATGLATLSVVLGLVGLSGCVRAAHLPARLSYAYDLGGAAQAVPALGLLNMLMRLGQLAGALGAGWITQRWGADAAYWALALAHAAAAMLTSRLRRTGIAGPAYQSRPHRVSLVATWQSLREYLREMRRNRTLVTLIALTAAVEILGFSFSTALPELAISRLEVGADGLGMLHGARSAGGLAAGLILANAHWLRRRGLAYLVVIPGFGLSLVFLAVAPTLALTVTALCLAAALASASDTLTQSMMQLSVPDRLRGRAMGAWVFAVGSAPIGHLELGGLAAVVGITAALSVNGAGLILIGAVAAMAAPGLRKL